MANKNSFLESPFEVVAEGITATPASSDFEVVSTPSTKRGSAPTQSDLMRRAAELDVDPNLAIAFFHQESSGNWNSPDSPKGARLGMQVMPGTYKSMMGTESGQNDPWNNMEAGLRYIRYGQNRLGTRDIRLLAAGYHAGYDHPALRNGQIPGTNDGLITTQKYADSIYERYNKLAGVNAAKNKVTQVSQTVDFTDGGQFEVVSDPSALSQMQLADEGFEVVTGQDAENIRNSASGNAITDVGRNLKIGANALAQDARELVGKIPFVGQPIVKGLDKVDEYFSGKPSDKLLADDSKNMQQSLTPEMQEALDRKWWDSDKGTFGSAWSDWRSWAGGITQSLPAQAATMVPAIRIAKAVYGARIAAGAAPELASQAAARAATLSGSISEGLLGGAQASRAVRDEIMQLKPEVLSQSDAYRSLISSGMSPQQAQQTLAEDGASRAFVTAGVATGIFGGMGDRAIAKIVTSRMTSKGMAQFGANVAKGVAGEGLFEELPQSAFQQLAQNEAVRSTANPNKPLTEDVANQALGGLALGAAQGGGIAAIAGSGRSQQPASPQPSAGAGATPPDQPAGAPIPAPIEPTGGAPSQARGPLERATENAATEQEKVIVDAPEGTVSGTVTGRAADGTTQIVGEDGNTYEFKVGENGVTMTPVKPSTPLTNAVDSAAASAAQSEAAQIQPAPTEPVEVPAASAPIAPITQAAPPPTPQFDLNNADDPTLRARLKYIADQAKINGGWNKTLMEERRRVESEINKRQTSAPQNTAPVSAQVPVTTDATSKTPILPKDLAGAKPRYSYGKKGFELNFESDIDRAAYITAQGKTSSRDAEYLAFVSQATGMTDEQVRAYGRSVRDAIKGMAKDASPGTLKVPSLKGWDASGREIPAQRMDGGAPDAQAAEASAPAIPAAEGRESSVADAGDNAGASQQPAALTTAERYNESVRKWNELSAEYKTANEARRAELKPQMDALNQEQIQLKAQASRESKENARAESAKKAADKYGAMPVGTKIGAIGYEGSDAIFWEKTGADEWTRNGIGSSKPTKTSAEMEGDRVIGQAAEEKPTKASKEDLDHLFGVDAKRAKALERIAAGKAWFNDGVKAKDFITKNGLKDTHEVVKGKGGRFEIQAKEQINGNDNRTAGQRDGAEAVGQKADGNEATAAAVQPDAAQEAGQGQVTPEAVDWKQSKPGDYIGAGNYLVKRSIKTKTEAEKLAADTGGSIALDPPRAWAVLTKTAPETEVGAPLPNATAPEQVRGVDDRELGQIVAEFNDYQKGMIEDGEKITHVFDAPKKAEIVRLNDKVKVYVKDKGWMTPAEAKAEIAKWKERAQAQGENPATRNANSQKVVLSLFDLSGEWSKPWEEAGYQVYRFDIQNDPEMGDVNNFSTEFFGDWFGDFEGQDIYAILAACPCTDFASSGARHFAAKDKDGRTVASVKLVHQTLATIEYFKPAVWAIENPVGRIEDLGGLPPWRLSFDPNHLGDTYTKKTLLWGRFNADLPIAPVEPTEGSKMWSQYGGKSLATKNARSVTPEGFSYGFFMANNAADHPAMAVANKYDRLSPKLIEKAINAGLTEQDIAEVVDDPYYIELDDAAAESALRDAIAEKKGAQTVDPAEQKNVAPGTRVNGATERAAADRLEKLYEKMSTITERNSRPGNAKAAVRSVIDELRKPSTVTSVEAVLEKASSDLMKNYGAFADVIDSVVEQLKGQNDELDAEMRSYEAKAEANPAKPAVSENKVFTEDAAEKARALLRKRLSGSQLNSGVDPEILQAGITLAGYHIEKGARTFAAYAQAMVADLGDAVKPYLKSWYMGVKYDPRAAAFEGMDNAADVESADVDALTAAPAMEGTNEPEALDEPGASALEGAPADLLSGLEPDGQARGGAARGGREDARGDERTGSERVQQSGGMGDGEGAVSVPAGRTRKGRGGEQGSGAVQRGKRAAKQDPAIDAGGSDLLTPTEGQRAQDRASDFQITAEDEIGEGGAKTKFRNNMAAIRLLKQLQAENRAATRDEQAVLAKYVGWGGLPQAFERDGGAVTKGWEKEAAELKEALTEEELAAAASSTRNAHYTSPEIVKGMWDTVKHFGFQGGRVLEPSVGVGNFFGLMPKDLRASSALNGVELDHITGGIAQKLYPQANVAAPVGFQDYSAPDNYFDLAIGNPPFGREGIYDPNRRKISGFSIHNYFFAKSIDTVKPNGVLAMVVTNRLLDSAGDKARQYIADRAEFLGAIRLPNNAFLKNAGTEVTTDIIFLRKLKEGEQPTGQRWMDVKTIKDANGKDVPLNEYFVRNPDMMLGEFGAFGSMYSPEEPALVARDGQDTAALLKEAIAKLPAGFMDAPTAEPTRETITPIRDISDVKIGSVFEQDGEVFERREDLLNQQQAAPVTFPNEKARERVLGMIGVRDALVKVRALQLSSTATDAEIEAARADLNKVYDAFVKANGPLNTDANKRLMRDDPSWPQIAALEDNFDKGISPAVAKSTGEAPRAPSAKKAAIFNKRTQSPYQPPQKASSAKDALVTSLAERGRVDLDYMAGLYGKTPDAIAKELGDLIYRNPVGGWETRDQYLSGNVKQKLAQAIEAAKADPAMNANVEALRAVQPADIEAVDIDVKVGAQWIPADVMEDFVRTVTEAGRAKAIYNPVNAQWTLTTENVPQSAQTQWGTDRVRVNAVLEAAANQKQVQVFDQHPDGSRTLNERETTAANEKVERVKAEWRRWIWEDDTRRERLARIYNDTFNTDVSRDFDGSHLTFPGKVGNDIIALRPHQANAIWRIVQSGTTLLDHVVGAGKTFTMIGGIMELRRMGLAKKPMLVVPNHLVGQWAEDFMKLYPGANILAATKRDFEKDNRKKLFARIATGDWDAVIVAHSSFGKVEVEPEFQEQFIKQQIADMNTSIEAMRAAEGKGSRNVKQIEKQKAALEEKLKRLFDTGSKDDNLYFGELGVDAVFVDEAHEFKNLGFSTGMQRVAGLGNPTGSNKAADLFMKVRSILKRTNGRNVVFATGTPISNTMAEMYTMQRYLDYETLQAQGIAHFDAWAKTFGEVVTDWELSPSGQYKMNSRFAKFVNMPELMQRYQSFADVINRDDINRQLAVQGKKLPVPKLKGGKPENVVVPRSNDQAQYIGVPMTYDDGREVYPEGSLIWRSENLPKKAEKGADNMLKIMSDARKAALDMRLIDPSYPDNPGSKVNVAADNIKAIYDQWEKDKGAQLVFIDLSTPKGAVAKEAARIQELMKAAEEGDEAAQEKLDAMSPDELMALESAQFSVYDDLKEKLIGRGIPEKEIAFIHDANTEQQKEELFGKVRSGRIRVLFGSTAKMGAGMNVQERLVALHHLDAPWRPSDLEQREGRIIRQGNKLYEADPENFEVSIMRYATKQTLDSRMWQTIEAKARFIEQVRKGGGSREVEDVAGEAANSAEMKAASSGNPLILEEMTLRQQIRKLENQQAEHAREQHRIRDRIRMLQALAERQDANAGVMEKDAKRVPAKFEAKIGRETFEKHGEAGEAILAAVDAMLKAKEDSREIGSYGGFALTLDDASNPAIGQRMILTARGDGEYQIEANPGSNPAGLALRLQNTVKGLADDAKTARTNAAKNRADIPKLEGQIKPWGQESELADAKARHAVIIDQLRPKKKEQPAAEGGEKPAMSRSGGDLEAIFAGLEGRGKARDRALAQADSRPDADTIRYIENNFWNILGELEDSGKVNIKC